MVAFFVLLMCFIFNLDSFLSSTACVRTLRHCLQIVLLLIVWIITICCVQELWRSAVTSYSAAFSQSSFICILFSQTSRYTSANQSKNLLIVCLVYKIVNDELYLACCCTIFLTILATTFWSTSFYFPRCFIGYEYSVLCCLLVQSLIVKWSVISHEHFKVIYNNQ